MDFLNSILNNIDEALITTDAQGKILYFNDIALNLSKEVLKRPLQTRESIIELLRTRDAVILEIFKDIRAKKKSFVEYPSRQGGTLYLEFNYIPVLGDGDDVTHIHIFIRDITPQKIFEKRLVGQAASISNLIEKANAIIIGIDLQGYIIEWNEYCSEISGYEKDDVLARKFSEVFSIKNEQTFNELLKNTLETKSASNYEIDVKIKSGEKAILLLNGTQRTSSSGNVTGIVLVGNDVTELTAYRKSLERKVEERTRELQEALKKEKEVIEMKSRFVSIASHEFRTPLSSIESAASYIKNSKGRASQKEVNKRIETIEKQVQHMAMLLDDVLTYGKSEAGKIQLLKTTIQLDDFITQITEDVSHSTKHTHQIKIQKENLPKEVITDEKLFRNIFTNLLTNAIKFSPGKSSVFLEAICNHQHLFFKIRDEGIGIPAEEINKIFEPFIRGKEVTAIHGTGLGLSIVKKAVELLEGTIDVDSIVGSGTTFTIKIPLHERQN